MPTGFQMRLQNAKFSVVEAWTRDHETALMVSDLEELVAADLALLNEMRAYWQDVRRTLREGAVHDYETYGQELRKHFQDCLVHLRSFAAKVERFRERLGEPISDLDKLNREIASFQDLHDHIVEMWPWSDRPCPPLDKEMVARSRNEVGEDIGDIIARLQSGGALVKE